MSNQIARRAFLRRVLAGSSALAFGTFPKLALSEASTQSRRGPGGFSEERLKALSETMQGFVDRNEAAGMVTMLYRHGTLAHCSATGWQSKQAGIRMRSDTIFHLASMTKPLVAAAALTLVDDATLALSEPIEKWIPELANRKVLKDPNGSLDDTVPATRPIQLVDLLTHRSGLTPGVPVSSVPEKSPITQAMLEADKARQVGVDAWLQQLSRLPLAYHPGSTWHYAISFDLLGVLIARASGMPLGDFMRKRLFDPLGMLDTGFVVPETKRARLASVYEYGGDLKLTSPTVHSFLEALSPPSFPSAEGGLYSSAEDYLRAARMLLESGKTDRRRILSRDAVNLMTQNYLTFEQRRKAVTKTHSWSGYGMGLGVWVVDDPKLKNDDPGYYGGYASTGSFGWPGAYGCWWLADPKEDMVQLLMIQLLPSHRHMEIRKAFQSLSYRAIEG